MSEPTPSAAGDAPRRRRPRYPGRHPRRFDQKYKEHQPDAHPDTIAKVIASGKTPAGSHRSILVDEILEVLAPRPGETALDATLGYGGHAREVLRRVLPGGRLIGLDVDPIELARTEARLRGEGFDPEVLILQRTNFAGLPTVLAGLGMDGVDVLLADLGLSSMQIDDPARGFSVKFDGPLDMRMNPGRGLSASGLLATVAPARLQRILESHSDEPRSRELASALAGRSIATTRGLVEAIRAVLGAVDRADSDATVRRVFQALRIAVNDEFAALECLLRVLPACLRPGGRAAILTFHSGEDRRVKQAFEEGTRTGIYEAGDVGVIRAGPAERRSNPRSVSAKLRWVRRAARAGQAR